MPTILALNPKKKKRKKPATKTKKEVKTMAAARKRNKDGSFKKTGRSSGAKTKTIVRYQTKKNPIKKRAKRAVAYGRQVFAGVNVGGAFRKTLPLLVGALAAKFAAKKFSDDPASEGDNWTWKNYGLGMLGGFVAAVATKMIFKSTAATTENVLAGAMLLMAYKCFVYEVAPSNEYLDTWFSEDEDDYLPDSEIAGYLGQGSEEAEPGDLYQADDDTYVMGQDHLWRSAEDTNRIAADDDDYVAIGQSMPVDPTMGDEVVPVDPTMGYMGNILNDFNKAYA